MKHYTQEIKNKQFDTHIVRHFYFKVNKSKAKDHDTFGRQVNKVIERIGNNYNLINYEIKMDIGYIEDDFICNVFRLRISVNCS